MFVNKSNVRKTKEVKEIVSTIIKIHHVKKIDTHCQAKSSNIVSTNMSA